MGFQQGKPSFFSYHRRVAVHSKGETNDHYIVKSAINKILCNRGRLCATELPLVINNKRMEIDAVDLSERNFYEVESTKVVKERGNYNVITIPLSDMPTDARIGIESMFTWLKTKVV